ncbi:MAG: ACT domain-containing protein, partial [Ignavibacteria bacterium]
TKSGANVNYTNLMSAELITDKERRSLAGTVFGNKEIRVVYIDNYHLELKPEGNMLVYSNIDKPGMLANVGKILAEADINIAGLSLGRIDIGKEALTVINVDNDLDKNVVSKIASVSGIKKVFAVKI